jgi:hypothetical protein
MAGRISVVENITFVGVAWNRSLLLKFSLLLSAMKSFFGKSNDNVDSDSSSLFCFLLFFGFLMGDSSKTKTSFLLFFP